MKRTYHKKDNKRESYLEDSPLPYDTTKYKTNSFQIIERIQSIVKQYNNRELGELT